MCRNPYAPEKQIPPVAQASPRMETSISHCDDLPQTRRWFARVPATKPTGALWLHVGVLACAMLLGAGSGIVRAYQGGAERDNLQTPLLTGQIACVDMERLYVASGGPEQLAQRANEITLELNARLKELKAVPLLDENELQEYGAITFKAVKTETDQARLKALRALSDQRQDELNKLQIKPDSQLTADDKTRMKQLQEQSRLLASILPYWQEDARAQQAERLEAFRRTQMARLRQIVGKAAAERNIAHVFDTTALVYSANDLTAIVLPRVSKRASRESKDGKENRDSKEEKAKDSKATNDRANDGADKADTGKDKTNVVP